MPNPKMTSGHSDIIEAKKIEGDIAIKRLSIGILGGIAGGLAIAGTIVLLVQPSIGKDVWLFIGPIISMCITSIVAPFSTKKE